MGLIDRIKSVFFKNDSDNKLYELLRDKAENLASTDQNKSIDYLKIAASLAWISNTSHKHDKKLDAVLHLIGTSLLSQDVKCDPNGVLVIVTSGILEYGGLTQQVENLVKYMPESQEIVIWTTEAFSNSDIHCERGKSITKRAIIKVLENKGDVQAGVSEIVEWAKYTPIKSFIYFLSPDDTTAFMLPSALPLQKHILINVSHHVFCLGSFQFDAIVDVSDHYYQESIDEHRNDSLHLIYLSGRGQLKDLRNVVKNKTRSQLGIPEDAYLTVTVGNPSKNLWDADQRYLHIIGEMLMENVKVHHLLIAKGMQRIKDLIVESYPKVASRIHIIEGTRELIPTLKCCDLYLNSFPMGGALSSLDAIAASLPIVAIPAQKEWFKMSDITALSQSEYIGIINMFIQDFEYRLESADALQLFYQAHHQPQKVASQYLQLIERLELGNKSYEAQKDFRLFGLKKHIDINKLEREVIQPFLKLGNEEDKMITQLRKQLS